jgi:trehalose/maltose hydrolase-like predicted phosphorylase
VAYNVWLYWHLNQDQAFMQDYGLEMLLSIAKFWLGMAQYDDQTKRYHIAGVMGPDEFHERYPNRDTDGLTDNAYTNMMVAWLFKLIGQLRPQFSDSVFQAAAEKADFALTDLDQLNKVRRRLTLVINEQGIIGQFAGYFDLPTISFDTYRKKYGDISRLDRILKAEGKTPDAYQVAKQADTLMAFFLLDRTTLDGVIQDMGYQLPKDYFAQNLQFYLDRTTHGSTLSRIVYAVLTRLVGRRDQSWKLFHQALFSDYYDIQGGTTAEGIHLGVMGAVLSVEMTLYGGVDLLGDVVRFEPRLPSRWRKVQYHFQFQGTGIAVQVDRRQLKLTADQDLTVQVGPKMVPLKANEQQTITYVQ